MFYWVPDGVYDHEAHDCRYVIVDGKPKTVVSKMWLKDGGPDTLPYDMKIPWGSYPDMPPKPPK